MNSGGTGYTSQPSITIVIGGGTGAAATASVRGPIKSIGVTMVVHLTHTQMLL